MKSFILSKFAFISNAVSTLLIIFLITAGSLCNNAHASSTNNLALGANTVSAANLCAGITKNPIVSFTLTDASTGGNGGSSPVISAISFTTSSGYAAADVVQFQLWVNTTSNSLSGASQLGSAITTSLGPGSHSFSSLAETITKDAGAYYFWVTVDIASSPTNADAFNVSALVMPTNFTFSTAPSTNSGTATAGGTQTIYTIPSAPTGSPTTVTYDASTHAVSASTTSGNTVDFYSASSGGTLLLSGTTSTTTFYTPSNTAAGTYTFYAQARNTTTGCVSSSRTSVALTINTKALTALGTLSISSKIYDGTTTATPTGSAALQGTEAAGAGTTGDGKPYSSDAVSLTGTAAYNFNTKDVATATSVTESGLSLTGTGNGNYTLTAPTFSATITQKALTALGTLSVPSSKVYDGTTTATPTGSAALLSTETAGTGTTGDGKPYGVDAVSLTGSAAYNYNSKDVASAATVTESGLSLTGTGNGNYTLTAPSFSSKTITAKAVTAVGTLSMPSSKAYDGTTTATPTGAAALQTAETAGTGTTNDGIPYSVDGISLTGTAAYNYNTKDVATATTVTESGLSLTGTGNGDYTLTAPTFSATITKLALTIGAPTIAAKSYDGTTTAGAVTVGTLSGFAGIETVTATGAAAAYSSANAGSYPGDVITYTLSNGTNGGLAANYSLANGTATGTINQLALAITSPTIASKIYDGTATAGAVTTGTLSGFIGSQTVTATATAAAYSSANVGSYPGDVITYTLSNGTNGGLAANYSLANGTATGSVTAKTLTAVGTLSMPSSKVYDGTTTATPTGSAALQGTESAGTGTTGDGKPYSVDAVSLTGTDVYTYNTKDVATATTVTESGLSLTGTGNGNYTLTAPTFSATITKLALTIGSPTIASKSYDGTTTAGAVTVGTLSGFAGSETITATGTAAAYSSANAGSYSGDVVTYTLSNGTNGGLAANYSLANGTATGTINQLALAITSPTIASKIYDGTTTAGAVTTGTLSGFIGSQTVTATATAAAYSSANVGSYPGDVITYTLSNGTNGGLAANYSLANGTATGTVTAKTLTAVGTLSMPSSKAYDGTTTATPTGAAGLQTAESAGAGTTGDGKPYSVDAVSLTGTDVYNYNTKDVTTATTVTESGLSLTGTGNGNYTLTAPTFSATITKLPLTIGAPTIASKIYDGTTTAGVVTLGTLSGFVGSETVTETGVPAVYSSANVGSYPGVVITYALHDGTNGGLASNYSLANGSATGTVTAKALTAVGTLSVPSSKIYNGTTTATPTGSAALLSTESTGTGTTSDGKPYSVDAVSLTGTAAYNYNSSNVGTATTVTESGLSLTGTGNGNYTLTAPTFSATITAKALTAVGTLSMPSSKVYDGTTTATPTGSAALLSTESAGAGTTADGKPYSVDAVSLTGTDVYNYNTKDVSTATTVTESGLSLTGTGNGNYTLTAPTFSATITKLALSITAPTIASKSYDGTTTAGAVTVGTLSGFVGSETVTATGSAAAYSSANVGSYPGDVVTYTLSNGTNGGLASNYSLAAGTATGTITGTVLSVTAPTIASKVYDGTTTAGTVTVGTLSGFIGSQTVTATATAAAYSSANVGSYPGDVITYTLHNGANGGLAANYILVNGTATGTVTAKALSITAPTIASKIYDGTTTAGAVTTGTLSGFVGSETVTATGAAAAYTSANVGSYSGDVITYTLSNGTNGGLAANYSLANGSATGTVTAKALTAVGTLSFAASKIYDGGITATPTGSAALQSTEAAGSGTTGDGKPYSIDAVSLTGTAAYTYNSRNVGTATTVTESGLSLTGTGNGNYTLTAPTFSATITAKALTAVGTLSMPSSKVYNGTTTAVPTGSAALQTTETAGAGTTADGKPYSVDAVSLTGTVAYNYNTKDVLTANTVTESGLSLTGTGNGNYTLTAPTFNSTITTKSLSITSPTIASKAYDGTTTAGAVTTGTLSGFVGSETVTATGLAAAYSSANVGSYPGDVITYTLSNGTNGGVATNYSLANGSATGTITGATLSITAPTIASKLYDGTSTAGTVTVGTLSGFIGSQTVTVTATAANYSSANVGSYPGDVVTYTLHDGTNGGLAANYTLANGTATGTITVRTLTITANNVNKNYGVTITGGSGSTAFTSSGLQNSETIGSVTITYGSGSAASAAVGTYAGSVAATLATGGTFTAGNYSISYTAGNIIVGSIPLTITANIQVKCFGQTFSFAGTEFTTSGLLSGDAVTSATITSTGAASTATVAGSPYSIVISAATGTGLSNYSITYVNNTMTIYPLPSVSVTPTPSEICNGQSSILIATNSGGLGNQVFSGSASPNLSVPQGVDSAYNYSTITLATNDSLHLASSDIIKVTVALTLTTQKDVDVFLVAPGSSGAMVLFKNAGSNSNNINTTLRTDTTDAIGNPIAAGPYEPQGSITTAPDRTGAIGGGNFNALIPAASLSGVPIDGAWSLRVFENNSNIPITLVSWSLTITKTSSYTSVFSGPATIGSVSYSGTGNTTANVSVTPPLGSNIYTVTTTDGWGCTGATATATVVVDTLATNITPTGATTICAGTSANISLANTQLGVNYQLRNNSGNTNVGSAVAGTGGTINLSTGNISSTTTYNVLATKVSTSCSVQMTGTVTITVNPLPTATISGGTTVCQNTSSPNVTFTGASGTAPYTFTYKINSGSNLNVTTTSGNSVTVAAPTSSSGSFVYSLVSVQDASSTTCSQSQSGSTTIVVNATPSTPAVTVTNNCASSTLSTTATGTLHWNTGATTSSITVSSAGTYSVTQTVLGCLSAAGTGIAAPITPCNLSYTSPNTFTAGTTISNLNPTVTGTVTSYSVSPTLPAGLNLNTSTGVISGTPTTTTATATYTVTAANAVDSTTTFGIVITVVPGALNNFVVEQAGGGNIGTQTAGTPFNIKITARDANGNTITSFNSTVALTDNSPFGSISPTTSSSFTNGVLASQTVTVTQAISQAITATNISIGTSNTFSVNPGVFAKLQILLPGETAAPGSATGKTGSPTTINTGTPTTIIVNGVDANWNVVSSSTDNVAITSSDGSAALPSNAALASGTQTFSIELFTVPSQTITASDATNGGITANTSSSVVVSATKITTATGGNWNVGSSWVGAVAPLNTDDAIIVAGATVTVAANAGVNSVTFDNSGTGTGTLTVNSGDTLNVTASLTAQNGTNINTAVAIAGAGTINCASFTMGGVTSTASGTTSDLISTISSLSVSGNLNLTGYDGGSGAQNMPTLELQSGSITVGGTVVLSENGSVHSSNGLVTLTTSTGAQNGTLILMGATPFSLSNSYTIDFNGTTATVNYGGAAQTVYPTLYNDITLSGSGSKGLSAGTSVSSVMSINGSAQADITNGLDISIVDRLWLGGFAQPIGTWGSTTANKTHISDTWFTQTTGYLTIASAGASTTLSGLTASQTICAGTSSITLSGNVSSPGPLYPSIGEDVLVIIDGSTQMATISNATGGFTINFNTDTITSPGSPYSISYYYVGNDTLNPSINTGTVLTVNQESADPSSASASAPTICNGQSSTLTLSGGGGGNAEVIQWYTSSCGGTSAGTGNSLSVSPVATTTYYGRYEDGAPCSFNSNCAQVTVTVNQPSTSSQSATACNSYTWNGSTYTGSGTYTFDAGSTSNSVSCDSVATLNLTINYSSTSSTSVTGCDSYVWNSNTYTSSGTYTYDAGSTSNSVGCDSVATLILTINYSSTSSTSVTNCDSYVWNGSTYTGSGTYTYDVGSTSNSAGCDSVATLILTINHSSTSSQSATSCDSYVWNGTTYTGSGTYTFDAGSTSNSAACDSVATLHLTINHSSTSSTSFTNCDSYVWNSTTYTSSGTYTFDAGSTSNSAGCDSVATLILTINHSTTSSTSATSCDSYIWNGSTYTSGGTYTFDAGSTSNSAGCDSVATLNLTINYSNTSSTSVTSCDSYVWNSSTYTSSGTYTYNAGSTSNSVGCDSVATLHLTINHSSTSSQSATSCGSYVWNGNTYTSNGTYTYDAGSTSNSAGCDSVATLHLTINHSVTSSQSATSCDSYVWNGSTYTSGGTYTFDAGATSSTAGCDSIATLILTINHSSTSSQSATACDSYLWNGTAYTSSGSYTYDAGSASNAVGCDSIATLNLTVNYSNTSTTYITNCDSFAWNGTTYTLSGSYTFNAGSSSNSSGCDSIATLNLTINNSSTSSASVTSCDNYIWNGSTYSTSGTYTFDAGSASNAAGCDSVATLNLTVSYSSSSRDAAVTTCDNYVWHGSTYTSSGTETYHTINAAGCDSSITIGLTINHSSASSTSATSCDSYVWNGNTYTTGGTYTYNAGSASNAVGCDSIATLVLTINHSSSSNNSVTVCDSYVWNGSTYTGSGTYTYDAGSASNSVGCDSIATLNLTVNHSSASSSSVTNCDSYVWNGNTYTTSATYTYDAGSTSNSTGCDSTATLYLTIHNSSSGSESQTACDSYVWNGTTYTSGGDKIHVFTNGNYVGCDSTATLHLTINPSPTTSHAGSDQTLCDVTTATLAGNSPSVGSGNWTLVSGSGIITDASNPASGVTGLEYGDNVFRWTIINATCSSFSDVTIHESCLTVNLKLFIQGYYLGAGKMSPLLSLLGISNTADDVDTVTVELHAPSNINAAAYSYSGILKSDGAFTASFPTASPGNYYYLVLKHRNSLETWSADSMQVNDGLSYDFTTAEAQSYGNNTINFGDGNYGIFSGDLNSDGAIDASDNSSLQSALQSFIIGVYDVHDITGDGIVDANDFRIMRNNIPVNITLKRPH